MTHNTNAFTPAHGWIAVREMLATIAARFDDLAALDWHSAFWRRAVLHWLRPAEHLARLLLFVIARALPERVKRAVARRRAATRPHAGGGYGGFKFTLSAPSRSRVRLWRARPPLTKRQAQAREESWWEYNSRDPETEEAERAARRAMRAPPPERPAPPPRVTLFPVAPLVARIAALTRVLADPDLVARRIGARARDPDHTARLLSPARILTATPCFRATLQVHDLAHTIAFPPDDTS